MTEAEQNLRSMVVLPGGTGVSVRATPDGWTAQVQLWVAWARVALFQAHSLGIPDSPGRDVWADWG
jgi:hypothetical protein